MWTLTKWNYLWSCEKRIKAQRLVLNQQLATGCEGKNSYYLTGSECLLKLSHTRPVRDPVATKTHKRNIYIPKLVFKSLPVIALVASILLQL